MSVVAINNDSDSSLDSSSGSSTAATDIEDDKGNGNNNEGDDDILVAPIRDCNVADNDTTTSTILLLTSTNVVDRDDTAAHNTRTGAMSVSNNLTAKYQVIQLLKEKIGILQEWNLTS
ncbi:hypothetical protein MHU86_12967 [Fragilaria crotonensis]|nr:hypothetical protein MHU86_12967 [Fragilaria crotonensis]